MPYTDVVARPFRVPGAGKLLVGRLVDAGTLEDAAALRAKGCLAPIERGTEPAQAAGTGDWYASRAYLARYGLMEHRPATVPRPRLRYQDEVAPEAEQEGFPRHVGRGTYQLSDGSTVRGKVNAQEAEAELAAAPTEESEADDPNGEDDTDGNL